ncbi:MAG: hypothetical protein H6738_24505 [Alphaproteobacteria bacterium]|nr:hypothetical protein [Alphaproteobacteria bacterium]MCB9699972.1 hypothetical protein [Alphaproteobacteria bacterium]
MDEVSGLRERAKELRCLYEVEGVLEHRSASISDTFTTITSLLPAGWRWPERTTVRIVYLGRPFQAAGFDADAVVRSQPVRLADVAVGSVDVSVRPPERADPFLDEEVTLLARVSARIGEYLEKRHAELLGLALKPEALHWTWRQAYAEAIARHLDMARFKIDAIYLGGSTEAGTAVSASDIDLYLLPARGHEACGELTAWLDGWSLSLAEMAHRQTGVPMHGGLLNVGWLREEPGAHRADLRCLRKRLGESPG